MQATTSRQLLEPRTNLKTDIKSFGMQNSEGTRHDHSCQPEKLANRGGFAQRLSDVLLINLSFHSPCHEFLQITIPHFQISIIAKLTPCLPLLVANILAKANPILFIRTLSSPGFPGTSRSPFMKLSLLVHFRVW